MEKRIWIIEQATINHGAGVQPFKTTGNAVVRLQKRVQVLSGFDQLWRGNTWATMAEVVMPWHEATARGSDPKDWEDLLGKGLEPEIKWGPAGPPSGSR